MGMQLVSFEAKAARHYQEQYGDEPGFRDAMRRQASHALAEIIMRDASLYERIEPTKEELEKDPFAPTRHRWRMGVERNMSEVEAREKQMEDARRQGLRDAAAELRKRAGLFDRVNGMCKHVLQSELWESARVLEAMANGQTRDTRDNG
jgi:hypothetical protein